MGRMIQHTRDKGIGSGSRPVPCLARIILRSFEVGGGKRYETGLSGPGQCVDD
jgi:hypothetical protein